LWSNDINSCIIEVDGYDLHKIIILNYRIQFVHEKSFVYGIVGKNSGLVKHKVIKSNRTNPLRYQLNIVCNNNSADYLFIEW